MIDILIPTFNRVDFLKKNIIDLNQKITKAGLQHYFRILVSDNRSTDNTNEVLIEIDKIIEVPIVIFRQDKNIGLESNALFLLEKASSEYVMYLGDDDYLPDGYVDFVYEKTRNKEVHCIIPGFSSLFSDGEVKPARYEKFQLKKYPHGFSTICELSNFGHQLSGLVTKRDGIYDAYMEKKENRNIYPFIFFVSYCMLRGETYYAPMYQVLVSQGNSKDWRYDDSGLLIDIFRNYNALFVNDPAKADQASFLFVEKQVWRLRIGLNPLLSLKAIRHLFLSNEVSTRLKFLIISAYPIWYFKKILSYIKKKAVFGANN